MTPFSSSRRCDGPESFHEVDEEEEMRSTGIEGKPDPDDSCGTLWGWVKNGGSLQKRKD